MTEAMREQFEAWHGSQGFKYVPERRVSGKYVNGQVQGNWRAYQAGYQTALRSPAVAGLVEACQKVVAALDGRVHSRDALAAVDASRDALAQYATLAGESHD